MREEAAVVAIDSVQRTGLWGDAHPLANEDRGWVCGVGRGCSGRGIEKDGFAEFLELEIWNFDRCHCRRTVFGDEEKFERGEAEVL
jgi:hypothetical protein